MKDRPTVFDIAQATQATPNEDHETITVRTYAEINCADQMAHMLSINELFDQLDLDEIRRMAVLESLMAYYNALAHRWFHESN